MSRGTVKRKPPSRDRYERSHPTVSCRIPKEIYERLREAKGSEGKSFAAILKTGLDLIEVKVKNEAEIREKAQAEGYKKGHSEGYKKGYAEAERLYQVTYSCNTCRKTVAVTSPNAKEAIKKYMEEHGWGHAECHKRSQ